MKKCYLNLNNTTNKSKISSDSKHIFECDIFNPYAIRKKPTYKFQKYIPDCLDEIIDNKIIDNRPYSMMKHIFKNPLAKYDGKTLDVYQNCINKKIDKCPIDFNEMMNRIDEKYTNYDHKKSNIAIDDNIKKDIKNKINKNKNKKLIKKMNQEEREKYFLIT